MTLCYYLNGILTSQRTLFFGIRPSARSTMYCSVLSFLMKATIIQPSPYLAPSRSYLVPQYPVNQILLMAGGKVAVPLHHLQGLVPQYVRNLQFCRTIHGEVRCTAMA